MPETYSCKECGDPLIQANGYSKCPSGHGKLLPKMPRQVVRRNHAIVQFGAQDARLDSRAQAWAVPGDDRLYEIEKRLSGELTREGYNRKYKGRTVALDGTTVLILKEKQDAISDSSG
jgi:DNA-directed RNA polymerase subunit RPC12/RpoP